ncbi:ricin-type beta-trefoil lectin domain protein [Streptomyces sp. TRM 70361]|uniref:RICIN domain-containing protein n=1 Tax=Streptomyces sp. TRM 70361 TaxID=3116553 RepID=UPI002E7BDBED|nr:ricin-type beta-trefoil lectin domain protein [Streptomyces sp. TRM 70361]MEE1941002.1 ricin-type beta-trefoil lectin domain protein [Streptomyces sp. TRM 70361]
MPRQERSRDRETRASSGPPENDSSVRRAVALPSVAADPGQALTPSAQARTPEAGNADKAVRPGTAPDERTAPAAASAAKTPDAAAAAPEPEPEPETEPTKEPKTAPEAATTPATTPASAQGRTPAQDRSTAATAEPAAAAVAASAAVPAAPLGTGAAAGNGASPPGSPKKPMLAAAGIAGSVLIAIPLLIMVNNGSDEEKKDTVAVADSADTSLGDDGPRRPPATYAPATPDAKPSAAKPSETPSAGTVTKRAVPPAGAGPDKETPSKEAQKKKVVVTRKTATKPPAKPETRTFRVVSADTGKCLSAGDGKQGARLVVWDCDGSQAQKWRFPGDGTVRIGDQCLDIQNGSQSTEAVVQLWECNGTQGQRFRLSAKGELVAENSGHCLDVWHGRSNGTSITTWHCNDQPNQRWTRT